VAIGQEQLETWSRQGGTLAAKASYAAVRDALAAERSPIRAMNYEVYLQGSYRNDTNVRADSDVDIVVQLNDSFGYDVSGLNQDQAQRFDEAFPNSPPGAWDRFRGGVLAALRASYGSTAVKEGSRCLKIGAGPGYLTADVIPATQFRKYESFYGTAFQSFTEGIKFFDKNGRCVLNYPKAHYDNGVAKNSENRTQGRFKPAVRMFKNARSRATERGYLAQDAASSYFVDCLIYNVPDNLFAVGLQDTYVNVVNFLHSAQLGGLSSRNGIIPLFGPTPEQWSEGAARQFIAALVRLWNEW
jgi:hypothetical protein